MKRMLLLTLIAVSGFLQTAYAQEAADSVCVYYRTGYRYVEPGYRNNGERLDRFAAAVRQAAESGTLERIVVQAGASPDGTQRANDRLVIYRADSLASYIVRVTGISADLVEKRPVGIMWDKLREQVAASDMSYRDEVLRILDNEPLWTFDEDNRVIGGRKKTLMDLRGGRPYNYMLSHFFPDLRNSALALLYVRHTEPEPVSQSVQPDQTQPAAETSQPVQSAETIPAVQPDQTPHPTQGPLMQPTNPDTTEHATDATSDTTSAVTAPSQPLPEQDVRTAPSAEGWRPGIRVKTNAIGWAMMMVNAAVEVDISRHLSVNLPIYYSACNYFTSKVKFRILATQPELRVWPLRNRRFFAGVHFGVASYNLALGGKWRIQDHAGNSPALGGGINVGYRIPLGRNDRWNVEFSLGAGIYSAHYDKFRNEANGAYSSTVRKTFVGLDNAAVSFSYKFDLKKTRK